MKLSLNSVLVLTCLAGGIAFGIIRYGHPGWEAHEAKYEKMVAANPSNLQAAEDELMLAIETAFRDKIPEKDYVRLYSKMGDLMMREGKYEDSEKYFLRVVQFNNALNVEVDENIKQLRKLELAYEKARDYEQAEQTQGVLVKLIEVEKSPSDRDYSTEKAKLDQLKIRVAQFNNPEGLPKVKVAEHVETPQELKRQESLLTGWH